VRAARLRAAAASTAPPPTAPSKEAAGSVAGADARARVVAEEAQYVLGTYGRPADVVFVRGEGTKLYDIAGKEYLDLAAGARLVWVRAGCAGGDGSEGCWRPRAEQAGLRRQGPIMLRGRVHQHALKPPPPPPARCFTHSWAFRDHLSACPAAASGIAVNALGHSDPSWVAALTQQAGQLCHTSNLFHTLPQVGVCVCVCAGDAAAVMGAAAAAAGGASHHRLQGCTPHTTPRKHTRITGPHDRWSWPSGW
jgi:hypothetical protein